MKRDFAVCGYSFRVVTVKRPKRQEYLTGKPMSPDGFQ